MELLHENIILAEELLSQAADIADFSSSESSEEAPDMLALSVEERRLKIINVLSGEGKGLQQIAQVSRLLRGFRVDENGQLVGKSERILQDDYEEEQEESSDGDLSSYKDMFEDSSEDL